MIQDSLKEIFNNEGYVEEGDIRNGVETTKCNTVFGLFLYSIGKHLKGYALKEMCFYCCLFRKALNEKGWEM